MVERIIETPPPGVYQWVLRRQFDGAYYRLRYRWNLRAGAWFVDWANDSNERQVYALRLGTGLDKLGSFKARDVPQGQLNVVDSTGQDTQHTLENFGGSVQLKYIEAEPVVSTPVDLQPPINLSAPLPPPASGVEPHAPRHEIGGDDPLTLTNIGAGTATEGMVLVHMGDGTATWQPPTVPPHAPTHSQNAIDQVIAENLATGSTDTSQVLSPDGSTGLVWGAPSAAPPDTPHINTYGTASTQLGPTFSPLPLAVVRGTPDATYFTKPDANNVQIETTGTYLVLGQMSVTPESPGVFGLAFLQLLIDGSNSNTEGLKAQDSYGIASQENGSIKFSGTISLTSGENLSLGAHYLSGFEIGVVVPGTQALTVLYIGP